MYTYYLWDRYSENGSRGNRPGAAKKGGAENVVKRNK